MVVVVPPCVTVSAALLADKMASHFEDQVPVAPSDRQITLSLQRHRIAWLVGKHPWAKVSGLPRRTAPSPPWNVSAWTVEPQVASPHASISYSLPTRASPPGMVKVP